MIGCRVQRETWTLGCVQDPREVRMQIRLDFWRDPGLALLRAEHGINQDTWRGSVASWPPLLLRPFRASLSSVQRHPRVCAASPPARPRDPGLSSWTPAGSLLRVTVAVSAELKGRWLSLGFNAMRHVSVAILRCGRASLGILPPPAAGSFATRCSARSSVCSPAAHLPIPYHKAQRSRRGDGRRARHRNRSWWQFRGA